MAIPWIATSPWAATLHMLRRSHGLRRIPLLSFSRSGRESHVHEARFQLMARPPPDRPPVSLLWLYARNAARPRLHEDRTTLPAEGLYTPSVRQELMALGLDVASAPTTAPAWPQLLAPIGNRIIGCVAAAPIGPLTLAVVMSPAQRAVRDFWQLTKYAGMPPLFLDFKKCFVFEKALHVQFRHAQTVPSTLLLSSRRGRCSI